MTDEPIEWRDPPPRGGSLGRRGWWAHRLAPLVDRPGEWAMVKRCGSSTHASGDASKLRHQGLTPPGGKWEFRASGCEVFARYVGPE